jgi:glycosyltransferase involved in cell wall biosynthesis
LNVSVLILTLNEELNISGCLQSVKWSNDVVVLDSHSSDATTRIAVEHGARVVKRSFDNYAAQRMFGLTCIAYANSWVFMLDADERVTAELRNDLFAIAANPPTAATLGMIRRRDHLFGRWIKKSSGYPTWFGRFAKLGQVWVERPINEEFHTLGDTIFLQSHLDHYPFNKGFAEWFAKHDRYSTMEAALRVEGKNSQTGRLIAIFSKDPLLRRRTLKAFAYSLPCRPILMFLGLYIVRGGFMEGRAGLTFSLLRAWYEFMIDCKCRELERRQRGLPI